MGIFWREGDLRRWKGCNLGKKGDLGEKKGVRDKVFLCDKKNLDFDGEGCLIFI